MGGTRNGDLLNWVVPIVLANKSVFTWMRNEWIKIHHARAVLSVRGPWIFPDFWRILRSRTMFLRERKSFDSPVSASNSRQRPAASHWWNTRIFRTNTPNTGDDGSKWFGISQMNKYFFIIFHTEICTKLSERTPITATRTKPRSMLLRINLLTDSRRSPNRSFIRINFNTRAVTPTDDNWSRWCAARRTLSDEKNDSRLPCRWTERERLHWLVNCSQMSLDSIQSNVWVEVHGNLSFCMLFAVIVDVAWTVDGVTAQSPVGHRWIGSPVRPNISKHLAFASDSRWFAD